MCMCVCLRQVPEASAERGAIASLSLSVLPSLQLPLPFFTFPLATNCLSTGVCASSGRKLEHGGDGRVHRTN